MIKKNDSLIPVLKRWVAKLNIERILLIASVTVCFLTVSSLREKSLHNLPDSKREKRGEGYVDKIKDYLGLPDEIRIAEQRISDITLTDPQTIFMKNMTSDKREGASVSINRNPFFPEGAGRTSSGKKTDESMIDKEELLFVGILNLDSKENKLGIVVKGSKSRQYKTLFEGDEWDGIKIIYVDTNFARVMNRKGIIQDYTTSPDRHTIK
ncbi:MAG: hypothetical protein E3K32_05225 [wastewater metagenome]|nr:hypothetical protein [Candidatus Loosdrechtia aerotolerans]